MRYKLRLINLILIFIFIFSFIACTIPKTTAENNIVQNSIAFTSNRDGNCEIYIMNIDGSGQIRLTNNPAFDLEPSFSPDGSKIVFETDRDGNCEIYIMNIDGSEQVRLTNNPANEFFLLFHLTGLKLFLRPTVMETMKSI